MRQAKKLVKFLLVTSFALQVLSIFTTTITGTMLLSVGDNWGKWTPKVAGANSPMGFLQENFEFEYLTSRISFVQGLFNWLLSAWIDSTTVLDERRGEIDSYAGSRPWRCRTRSLTAERASRRAR